MSLNLISANEAIAHYDEFHTVIDARSEGEYAEDHLPGAVNWPTLHDEERKSIGTLYKQVNAFEAKKRGAALAARNIALHIEAHVIDKPRSASLPPSSMTTMVGLCCSSSAARRDRPPDVVSPLMLALTTFTGLL